mmetsp:Transcript_14713/g.50803  ORF Transcript_14713/g.50803 Transcript_14713/m.50803 type:complete len:202 (-) Transcript_14713:661-1266(-)
MTLALLNMPSLRETTMNWDALKCARSMLPMFCVWLRSSAASTSSRMYMGAGLKRSMDSTRLSAMSDRWPPLSSESESFQRLPNATLTSRPSSTVSPAGGSSLALAPGSRLEKMDPKSWFTLRHVASSVSCFLTSSSPMTASIFALSRATVPFFVLRSSYSRSAFSIMPMTRLLIFLARASWLVVSSSSSSRAFRASRVEKS